MGLTAELKPATATTTDEEELGLPAQPSYDQDEIRSAISDAGDVENYVAKALKSLEHEDYDSVKGHLQDIETSSSSAAGALTAMEQAISRHEAWGEAWKDEALSRPTNVIELLDNDYRSCLNQVTEIMADEDLPDRLIDEKSKVVLRSWGIDDPELAAVILAVCKIRGEALYQQRKGPQPVVPMETKIREITGKSSRPFF